MYKESKFEGDLLDRAPIIENLSKIISTTKDPLVFALDAPWGAGKTIFVKELWRPYLLEQGIESFYFSAWENDFSEEPLVVVLGELEKFTKDKGVDQENFKKLVEISRNIITSSLSELVKTTTNNALDISALIKEYSHKESDVKKFKEKIKLVLKDIKTKPFVIFIDELDRCRPLYAIEFLERIEHLFGIENLIFILSIDKKQLAESIKSQYGNIDTDNYLRRFINLEYRLPEGNTDNLCQILYERFDLKNILAGKNTFDKFYGIPCVDFIQKLVKIFTISPRMLEQLFSKLNIIYKTIEPRLYSMHFVPLIFLESLKSYDSNLYYGLITGKKEYKDKVISLIEPSDKDATDVLSIFNLIVRATRTTEDEFNKLIKTYSDNEGDWRYNFLTYTPDKINNYRINAVIENVIKKIDFVDRFVFENDKN